MNGDLELNEGFEPLEETSDNSSAGTDFMQMQSAKQSYTLTQEQAQTLPALIEQMIAPLMETMAKMIAHNTEALNQVARTQQAVSYTHLTLPTT